MAASGEVLVFACGPRPGGNSDTAASLVARGVAEAGGLARIVHLRDHRIIPCLGCRKCAVSPGHVCVLAAKDDCEELFSLMLGSRMVVFCSPIYFYHVPAIFKALIDRAQRFYELRRLEQEGTRRTLRPATAVLVAGRPRGEKLFDGALLTLKYFLDCFHMRLDSPLTLRGIDEAGALASDEPAAEAVLALGRAASRPQD